MGRFLVYQPYHPHRNQASWRRACWWLLCLLLIRRRSVVPPPCNPAFHAEISDLEPPKTSSIVCGLSTNGNWSLQPSQLRQGICDMGRRLLIYKVNATLTYVQMTNIVMGSTDINGLCHPNIWCRRRPNSAARHNAVLARSPVVCSDYSGHRCWLESPAK